MGFPGLGPGDTTVLNASEERGLLRALHECKQKLAEAVARIPGEPSAAGTDEPGLSAGGAAAAYRGDPPGDARLGAIYCRYNDLRGRLALANLRLVAHVAKPFRDRGIAYADLIQEGFCGLLEAIDRFDLARETKLATYATWWIRQSVQRAVAEGSYPVRLSPRHLRQLARFQDDAAPQADPPGELIRRIHTATRPTVALDAAFSHGSDAPFTLLHVMADRESGRTEAVDLDETMEVLLDALRPREREVVRLRFGLESGPRMSLSEVGKVLGVSKERVRQIQDRALEKLRGLAAEKHLDDLLSADD
jgi:RNA polymerase primary sigma factor